ncbi:MAG: SdrD B-like domain-containing protein [Gemmataceae bacterium]
MRKIEMSSWRRWVKTLFNRRTPPITTKYHHKPKIECLEDRSVPASITGMAFQDFNSNGAFDTTGTLTNSNGGTIRTAIDVGVGNVTVTAYDALNTAVASSTTSGVDGTYTLTGLTTGTAYRVEFSGQPAGYFPGPIGLDSGSTVQYVVGGATKVDVGLVNPNQYSANNPTIVSEVFAAGDPLTGSNKNNAVVMSLPYLGGGTTNNSNTPASTTLAKASQVGAVLGIATSRQTGLVFVAAYTKIHTGYGPTVDGFSGNGSIYAINPVTKAVNVLVNFNQLFGAGTSGSDFRAGYAAGDAAYVNDSIFTNGAYTDSTGSYTSWNAVGKTAFGGMAVSDDGSTLYVMNLANRRLYAIPLTLGRPLAATDLTSVSIPFNAPNATGTNGGTQAGDLQPFAVTFYNGQLYVGIVNSAESTQNAADLHAYVYQVDPQTLTFGSSPIFTIADMTYKRDYSARYTSAGPGNWHPWTTVYKNVSTVGLVYAQPMLSGIAFDTAGNMTLAFRDRVGDQGGNTAPANPANQTATYETYPAGETLRAFGSFSTGWTLENNGKGPSGTPVGNGVNTGFGPGGGQFYQQDYSPTGGHGYVESGSVAQMPGFPDVVVAAYDPFLTGNFRTGGLRFQNTDNGKIDKAYQLYAIDQSGTFGKANGVGGVAFVNTLAPIEIGNYVWNDSNSDGIQNAGEIGIAGVTVNLVDASNTVVASAQTDSNGQYLFSSAIGINTPSAKYGLSLQPNTNYTVRLDNSADYTTGPLKNLTASPVSAGTDSSVDSNGVTVSPTDIRASVTTGNYGQNNHTYDFGFTSVGLSLGNFVWNDTNNDGVVNNGETGLANVSVSLLNGAGTVVANTTTSGAGYYLFTNLTPGNYQVRINASNFTAGGSLAGYVSSSGTNNAYEPTTQGLGSDGTDHGSTQGNGSVLGSVVILSVGGQTTGQPATPGITDPAADGNRDVSQDFGFYQPLSLGNFVWNDTNNDGVVNNGETGLANVSVSLLNGAGTVVANTTTSGAGYYLFTNLTAGSYQVRINASNFTAGGSLAGYVSSSGTNNAYEPTTQGLGGDGTDHGTTQGDSSVLGSVVTLSVGGQTTGQPATPGITDPAADGNRDVSQDFGFYQPLSLGNFVWNDANNDGVVNNGETGLANVSVSLLNGAGTVVANTTTSGAGYYLFTNLTPGNYQVRINASNFTAGGSLAGYVSSSGTNNAYEPTTQGLGGDGTDHGTTQGNGSVLGSMVSLTVGGQTTGQPATPGITDPAADGNRDMSQDFGFYQPLSLGNFVWNDANNDGIVNNGETGLANVSVSLLNGAGTVVANTTTSGAGYYLFTNLTPGNYQVRINASNFTAGGSLAGYVSSSGTNNAYEPTTQGLGGDGTDHGTTQGNGSVLGSVVTLSVGGQTTGQPATPGITDPAADGNRDVSQDFGFYQPLSLGNFVWNDANNDGVVNNGETGLANVSVSLLNGAGTVVANTTTSGAGYYLFTNLTAGNYQVRINASNFTAGGSLAGYVSSTGTNGSATGTYEPILQGLGSDGTDHGTAQPSGSVLGSVFMMSVGSQAKGQPATPGITDPAADGNRDVSQDFGFFQPLSLGNYVWNDANNNGVVDNGEKGLANVSVSLLNGNGAVVATTATNATGHYLFTDLIPGTYQVRINATNFSAGGALAGYVSSTGTNGSATGAYEPIQQGLGGDNTDHGSTQPSGSVLGSMVMLSVGGETSGQPATPGITDPAANGNRDVSQDFGFFQPLSLGNFVWNDTNNDGVVNNGETGLANVSVSLLNGAGSVVTTTTSSATGYYLFTNLTPGTYQIRIDAANFAVGGALASYVSSTGTNGSATGAFEPILQGLGSDGTDHGTAQPSGSVLGSMVMLSVGGEATGQPTTPGITDPAADGNRDVSQDFGFFQPLSLGNFVWKDTNNNGVVDNGETGLANVSVSLLNGTGNVVANTTTSSTGYYLFTDLIPGRYQVRIDATNFSAGGSLSGYVSSTGTNGSATGTYEPSTLGLGGDNTDHGTTQGNGSVLGTVVTLSVGGETTGQPATPGISDPAANGNRDVSQDFGFFQPLSLGNLVWNDANNNGLVDVGEAGIPNVTVRLMDSGNSVLATTTTDGTGHYLFPDMLPGTYHVAVVLPANYISSTGTNGQASGPFEPGISGNLDDQDHGTMTGSVVVGPDVTLAVTGSSSNPDANGTANLRQDFGLFQPLSLGNLVFLDSNNNGVYDAGDAPMVGISVQLKDAGGNVVGTQTTDVNGNYLFTNLIPGTYSVSITPVNSLISSTGKAGSPVGPYEPVGVTGADNSDHGTTSGSLIVALGIVLGTPGDTTANPTDAGFSNKTIDFGLTNRVDLGQVSGHVYLDPNINGVKETGERPIPGTTITLTGNDLNGNPVTLTTTTDTTGFYQFTHLLTGTYTITETQPKGLLYDGLDSIGTLGGTEPVKNSFAVSLPINGTGINYNFGEIPPTQVIGYVYEDLNQNNTFDPGESGIPNVTINIAGTAFAGTPLARPLTSADSKNGLSTTTDANGRWNFYGLPPGNYTVTEVQPTNYDTLYNSSADKTGLPVTVGNQFNDVFSGIVSPSDTTRGNLNFGEILPANLDPTKRSFFSSSVLGNGSAGGVGQAVSLNPSFPAPGSGTAANPTYVAVGSGPGQAPLVRVFNYTGGFQENQFEAYESSYTGGVRVAVADVNGDGIPDIITGTEKGGGPRIRVFNGANGTVLYDFFAYESSYRGGLFIAAGDINGDGKADLIVSADTGGGPRVRAFSGTDVTVLQDFFAFDSNLRTGVRVATGDVNGDGKADIIATTGAGTVTTVSTFNGTNAALINTFQPFGSFSGGAYIAAGNTSGGAKSNIIVTPDVGGGPLVATFNGETGANLTAAFAYDSSSRSGVRVAAADVNGDGIADVIVAPGVGTPSQIKILNGANLTQTIDQFYAFDTTFLGGAYVA